MVGAASERVACPQKDRVTMARHCYSLEFKDEACRLVMDQKQSVAETSRVLKVPKNSLLNWLKKRGYGMTVARELPSETNDPAALKARIRELEARVKRGEMES